MSTLTRAALTAALAARQMLLERQSLVPAEAIRHLTPLRNDGTRAELRFAAGAGVRERVDAIVAAESDCCAFLTM